MGYYQMLGDPIPFKEADKELCCYKGLLRDNPFINPDDNQNSELIDLYSWYIEYVDTIGINENDYDKLVRLKLILHNEGFDFDVIYFDTVQHDEVNMTFLGYDVASSGRYSLLGEGFLELPRKSDSDLDQYVSTQNSLFKKKLNSQYLFDEFIDALKFKEYLDGLNESKCNIIETCPWDVYFIYEVMVT